MGPILIRLASIRYPKALCTILLISATFLVRSVSPVWQVAEREKLQIFERTSSGAYYSKSFVYLIQSANPRPPGQTTLLPNVNRDVMWLVWQLNDDPPPSGEQVAHDGTVTYFQSGLSWTEGRNFLLDRALEATSHRTRTRKFRAAKGYLYYIFLDDDILAMSEFSQQNWTSFENWLQTRKPAVGYILGSTEWHSPHRRFNVDANINAYHRSTIGTLLPYDASLDNKSVYFSQYIQNSLVAALYASQREFWPAMTRVFDQAKNFHNRNNITYKRSSRASIPKRYLSSLWRDPAGCFSRSFAAVHCNSLDSDKTCDYNIVQSSKIPMAIACCGEPVDSGWIQINMNITHPFAIQKLAFIHRHEEILIAMRKSGACPPCHASSFSSLACMDTSDVTMYAEFVSGRRLKM